MDDNGNPLEGPEMEAILEMVTQRAQLAQLARIRKAVELDIVKGKTVSFTFNSTDSPQHFNLLINPPYTPWATVSFTNQGPKTVFIALNGDTYYKELVSGGVWDVDFSKARRRLDVISYYCNATETATVLADGKY